MDNKIKLPFNYRGYVVRKANPSGGKAGKGLNRTSTVQASKRFVLVGDRNIYKHFRYEVGDMRSFITAVAKAIHWINEVSKEPNNEEQTS